MLCWLTPKLHKEPLVCFWCEGGRGGCVLVLAPSLQENNMFSFGVNWERSHVVWWWQLGGKCDDSSEVCTEQCRTALRSSKGQPALSRDGGGCVLWEESAQEQPWQGGTRGRKLLWWDLVGCVIGLGDTVKKPWGYGRCGIILVSKVLCDLIAYFKVGKYQVLPVGLDKVLSPESWN